MKLGMAAHASTLLNMLIIILPIVMPLQVAAGNLQYGQASYSSDGGGAIGTLEASGAAAVSPMLFNGGLGCGACYKIWCNDTPERCKPGSTVTTVTNICTPNSISNRNGTLCSPPEKHFQLPVSDFLKIAYFDDESVYVAFRRMPCVKNGGINFKIMGRPNFTRVLITNVAGEGAVIAMSIKGSRTDWHPMSRDWCQNWRSNWNISGQSLSFKVTTSDYKTLIFSDVAPANWEFGETYTGHTNF